MTLSYPGIRLRGLHSHDLSITYPSNLHIRKLDTLIVDSMLGKLAQWLRMAGICVIFSPSFRDEELIDSKHVVITRDEELFNRRLSLSRRSILVRSSDILRQLSLILDTADIDEKYFPVPRYCTVCGGPLREVDVREVYDKVPENIVQKFRRVYICERCGKVYWRGSHHKKISERFEKAFNLCKFIDRVIICVKGRSCMLRILNI
ncbi:MAG: hypothetical protein GXO26_05520 [Crenarchaeota archaeon]|nr:hypothetical protein [Thermoproteota archaeon]